ncbi:MAG: hypothetical protein Q8J63_04630 [Candidatus Aquicultor sp.]|nr:hypothetical protein [Candidatus Aquicultor sp.]
MQLRSKAVTTLIITGTMALSLTGCAPGSGLSEAQQTQTTSTTNAGPKVEISPALSQDSELVAILRVDTETAGKHKDIKAKWYNITGSIRPVKDDFSDSDKGDVYVANFKDGGEFTIGPESQMLTSVYRHKKQDMNKVGLPLRYRVEWWGGESALGGVEFTFNDGIITEKQGCSPAYIRDIQERNNRQLIAFVRNGDVCIASLDGSKFVQASSAGRVPPNTGAAWSPDGQKLAWWEIDENARWNLVIYMVKENKSQRYDVSNDETSDDFGEQHDNSPLWYNNNSILYGKHRGGYNSGTAQKDFGVFRFEIDKEDSRMVAKPLPHGFAQSASLRPDKKSLAFSIFTEKGLAGCGSVALPSGEPQPINGVVASGDPSWTNDNKSIVFSARGGIDGKGEVKKYDLADSKLEQLIDLDGEESHAAANPKLPIVAFAYKDYFVEGNDNVVENSVRTVGLDGGNHKTWSLLDDLISIKDLVWSLDGDILAYTISSKGATAVHVKSIDGSVYTVVRDAEYAQIAPPTKE